MFLVWETWTLLKMYQKNPESQDSDKTEAKYIETEEQSPDYDQSEYTTPYYLTNDQAKASVKCLKTTAKVHYMHNKDTEHIRSLWVAQSQGSQILQTDWKSTQELAATSYQPTRLQQLFSQE